MFVHCDGVASIAVQWIGKACSCKVCKVCKVRKVRKVRNVRNVRNGVGKAWWCCAVR